MVRRSLYLSSTIVLLCLMLFSSSASLLAQEPKPTDGAIDTGAVQAGGQLLVFEVNRSVTKSDRGFPRNDPPRKEANGNWRAPINYAEGTLYYRVEIRRQPTPQNMKLQFCIWQDNFRLESCGIQKAVRGNAGTVVAWSQTVPSLWKKGGKSIDWSRPRQRYGIAIKTANGKPVSDYKNWRWNGQNPAQWYPLDMRFTVVVVPKGAQFNGWENYGGSASDNALITDETNAALASEERFSKSEDGSVVDFGSGMDFTEWESESATDAVEIEDEAETLSDEARDNKLYLPMVGS